MNPATVIRMCYAPEINEVEVRWRLDWFRHECLPRVLAQDGAEVDPWVWVHPRHAAEVQAMDRRVRTFTVREIHPVKRHPIRGVYPWRLVRGLPRYAVQVRIDSDDLIGPQFVRTALDALKGMVGRRALVHFQPYKFDVETRRIYDCGIATPSGEYHYRNDMPSMFQVFRQRAESATYTWLHSRGHTRMDEIADAVQLIPAGHCLLSVHRFNDSTTITPADAPLEVSVPWL